MVPEGNAAVTFDIDALTGKNSATCIASIVVLKKNAAGIANQRHGAICCADSTTGVRSAIIVKCDETGVALQQHIAISRADSATRI